ATAGEIVKGCRRGGGPYIRRNPDLPEHPTMSFDALPYNRRDALRLGAGVAACLGMAASPVAALAQTAPGGAPLKIATIGAGRDGEELTKFVEQRGGAGLATAALLPGAHLVRAFNAIGFSQLPQLAHRQGDPVGVPIAGDDQNALAIASGLIKEIGFEPVVVG